MVGKFIKALLVSSVIGLVSMTSVLAVQAQETLKSEKIADNISVIAVGDIKIHTVMGISNSHIIETKNKLWVIDTQFIAPQTLGLKKYLEKLGKPIAEIILSHNHPDHWFGAHLLVDIAPIAATVNIADDLKKGGMRYINILKNDPKLKSSVPSEVIVPSQTITLGQQNWDGLDVIVEEFEGQEAHHNMLIKIPSMGVMIGQDLFYNNMFLVASERERNKHWREILQSLSDNEAKTYKTLLVGHGQNGGANILAQDIKYLDTLEMVLAKDMTQEETTKELIALFPDKGGKAMLNISMRNLFKEE